MLTKELWKELMADGGWKDLLGWVGIFASLAIFYIDIWLLQ